jgi:hypothetical protein
MGTVKRTEETIMSTQPKQELVEERRQATVTDSSAIMAVISKAASDPQTDVDKLERMMALYERMEAKKAEQAFHAAMVDAQQEMRPIAADANNPQTKSKYASYAKLDNKLRPIYTGHGFSLSFDTEDSTKPDHIKVLCYVSHSGGYSRAHHVDMPTDGKGAKGGDVMTKTHAAGAAMSYGVRYLLKMIFNVAVGEDDTDGNMPIERVSQEQAANIRALMTEVGAIEANFLKYMQAKKIEDIQAGSYDHAIKMLERKRAK